MGRTKRSIRSLPHDALLPERSSDAHPAGAPGTSIPRPKGDLEAEILALLALDGRLGPLRDRATGKAAWLEGIGGPTSLVRADPGPAMAWFRAYIRAPEAWTDAVLAGRLGWRSVTDMADDVVREFLFRTSGNGAAPARALVPAAAGDR